MKKCSVFFSLFFFSLTAFAQPKAETEVRVTLRDGSSFSGKTVMGNVSLATAYGKLEVPLVNVTSIELGIAADKSNETKIINLIKQMGNSSADLRKSAYEELIKMNAGAVQVISDFIYSEKYMAAEYSDYTPETALNELKAALNIEEHVSNQDVVMIDGEYTMGGIYDFKKIELKTEYGTLSLPKDKIKRLDVLYTPSGDGSEKAFILLANKHISSNASGGWLKTGIMLRQGQKISVFATGEVTFASLSNNKYKPDGAVTGGNANVDEGYEGDYAASGSSYPVYGNVVYKIGESGTLMKAGAKFIGTAKTAGMLYLSIYETVYNSANTGSYSVKVSVR